MTGVEGDFPVAAEAPARGFADCLSRQPVLIQRTGLPAGSALMGFGVRRPESPGEDHAGQGMTAAHSLSVAGG